MTVQDLIERLKRLPRDADVWVQVSDWDGWGQLEGIDVCGAGQMVVIKDTEGNEADASKWSGVLLDGPVHRE